MPEFLARFTRSTFNSLVASFSLLNLTFFAVYFAWLLVRLPSPKVVIDYFSKRMAKKIKKGKYQKSLANLEKLVQIGKDIEPGYEKGLVLTAIAYIAEVSLKQGWSAPVTSILSRVVLGMREVLMTGQRLGNDENAIFAIEKLEYLYMETAKSWPKYPFDYARFAFSISRITQIAIEKHYAVAAQLGLICLLRICEEECSRRDDPLISPARLASYLDVAGQACAATHRPTRAFFVFSRLLNISRGKEILIAGVDVRPIFLFHALNVGTRLWSLVDDLAPLDRIFGGAWGEEEYFITKALAYGNSVQPFRIHAVKSFLGQIRVTKPDSPA